MSIISSMTAHEIRQKYLEFFQKRGHNIIPRANLVPENDPTTLFTGSGMQPLLPYLLGQKHPSGTRLTDSQPCFRAEDIDEVGDNRHTTFFEMLGNWGLGDYFKQDQIPWFWELLTKEFKLDPNRIYVTCFIGDEKAGIPKDSESGAIWKKLFKQAGIDAKEVDIGDVAEGYKKGEQGGRVFYYRDKNWWSRVGEPVKMPVGEPGGPDTEVFYLFPSVNHDLAYGKYCHPNCDCGRYIELGNSVFMEYVKQKNGFSKLPSKNVDYGGGLERIAAAVIDSPDMFKVSVLWPIIEKLEQASKKSYEDNKVAMQVIADHMRGTVFMACDGVMPSNQGQGYVMRRFSRRAIRRGYELGVNTGLFHEVAPVIVQIFEEAYPEVKKNKDLVVQILEKEERTFRQTLQRGLREFDKIVGKKLTGELVFRLFDTYGFPPELSLEEAKNRQLSVSENWQENFDRLMKEQRERSHTASKGMFKGGLAEHTEQTTKYHTATHLMYQALRQVLGSHVDQRGSNITAERLRFDFSHPQKVTLEQLKQIEDIVNEQVAKNLPVSCQEMPTDQALKMGASGHFGEKYGPMSKVYIIGDVDKPFSMELCGGSHVTQTGVLGEDGKKFKIVKEESIAAGVRRIKAILE